MEDKNESIFSVESVDFIFRHPWIVVCSFLIVFNMVQSYVASLPPRYLSRFDISFDASAIQTRGRSSMAERKTEVEKIVSGDNLRKAVEAAVEGLSERERVAKYNQLMENITTENPGLWYAWDESGSRVKMGVGFYDKNPKVEYKLIQTIMDMILEGSVENAEKKMKAETDLLSSQLNRYKEKIDDMNNEMEDIKDELLKRFPELSEEDRELVKKEAYDGKQVGPAVIQKFTMYDETLSKLNSEVSDLTFKKEELEQALASGTYNTPATPEQVYKNDTFINEYSGAITAKELDIASMTTKGYKKEHPAIKSLEAEIAKLKDMRKSRMEVLKETGSGLILDEAAKEKLVTEKEEIGFKIEYLKRKINQLENTRKGASKILKEDDGGEDDIKAKVAKLAELKRESAVIDSYYQVTRKKLEDARIQEDIIKEDGGVKITVLQKPQIPVKPSRYSESTNMILGGVLFSLLTGVGLAYLVDKINNPVRSRRELIENYALPVLGTIDRFITREEARAESVNRKAIVAGTFATIVVSRIMIKILMSLFFVGWTR